MNLHPGASTSFGSCVLFGPRSPLIMPECWLTPSSPVVSTIATACHSLPGRCHSPSSSIAGAERWCASGCTEEEMGQYHSDHSRHSSPASGATACRLRDLSTGVQVSSSAQAPYLVSMISPVSEVSTRRHLRSAGQGDLVVPRTRTAGFVPRSFPVAGPSAWNSLPPEIKTASLTLGQFSDRLKTEMFLRSYYATTRQRSRHNCYYKTV